MFMSSIVKLGYQDNLKPVFFFLAKIFYAQKKHQSAKQATFTLLEACARKKLLPLLFSICLILFFWLMFVMLINVFVRAKSFRKKK